MAIAYAQSTSIDAGAVSSGSLTFPLANTLNGLITVGLRYGSTIGSITSLSDTRGNAYTLIFSLAASSGGHTLFCHYAQGISSGPNTVSVVLTSAASLRWAIHEYTGLLSAGALDKFASTRGLSSTPTSPTVTNAGVNQLLFGVGTVVNVETFTAGPLYTLRETQAGKITTEDRIVATTGSFNASYTLDLSDAWTMGIATFLSTSLAAASRVSPRSLALLGVGV